jgi:hypothetical protein
MHDQVSISTAGFWWAVSSDALASLVILGGIGLVIAGGKRA